MDKEKKKAFFKAMGERVARRRAGLDITQEQLAKAVGYKSDTSIGKIELGLQGIPQSKMNDFCRALHCDISYLMGDYDDDKESAKSRDFSSIGIMKRQIASLIEIEEDPEVMKKILLDLTERR